MVQVKVVDWRGKVRAAEKLFVKAIEAGDTSEAVATFPALQATLARGAKWGMLHRKRASAKTAKFASMLRSVVA